MEENNPFDDEEGQNKTSKPYYKDKQDYISTLNTDWDVSEEGLAKKERELKEREEALQRKEGSLLETEKTLARNRKPNWPFFRPFMYLNIKEDMKTLEAVKYVRLAYFGWYLYVICAIYNVAVVLTDLIVNTNIGGFILSVVLLILVPLMFMVFRTFYSAARKESAALYVVYFCLIWWEIINCLYFAVGYSSYGAGGFLLMLSAFSAKKNFLGIMALVCFVIWLGCAILHFVCFWFARKEYRAHGGMKTAKQQAVKGGIQLAKDNPDVAKEIGKTAVNVAKDNPDLLIKGAKVVAENST